MSIARTFRGHVQHNKLTLSDDFWEVVRGLNGKLVEVLIRPYIPPRTLSQNAFFHGYIVPTMAAAAGVAPAEMKEDLKNRFLREWDEKKGMLELRSTASLTQKEMHEFLEHCKQLAVQTYGITIIEPGDLDVWPEGRD